MLFRPSKPPVLCFSILGKLLVVDHLRLVRDWKLCDSFARFSLDVLRCVEFNFHVTD